MLDRTKEERFEELVYTAVHQFQAAVSYGHGFGWTNRVERAAKTFRQAKYLAEGLLFGCHRQTDLLGANAWYWRRHWAGSCEALAWRYAREGRLFFPVNQTA